MDWPARAWSVASALHDQGTAGLIATGIFRYRYFPIRLCRFPHEKRVPVLRTPGVVSIVSFGACWFLSRNGDRQLEDADCLGFALAPWPHLRWAKGEHRLWFVARGGGYRSATQGPVALVVNIQSPQRSVAVEFDRDVISGCIPGA